MYIAFVSVLFSVSFRYILSIANFAPSSERPAFLPYSSPFSCSLYAPLSQSHRPPFPLFVIVLHSPPFSPFSEGPGSLSPPRRATLTQPRQGVGGALPGKPFGGDSSVGLSSFGLSCFGLSCFGLSSSSLSILRCVQRAFDFFYS